MEPSLPWTSNSVFEVRRDFVMLALSPDANIRGLCRRFNISAKTGYQTLERFRSEGEEGLLDHSRAPHRRPSRSLEATELAVLSIRADHPTWGGRKIASHLKSLGAVVVPAPSTITAILVRNGRLKMPSGQLVQNWLLEVIHKEADAETLPRSIIDHPDLQTLLGRLKSASLRDRRRSLAVLGDRAGFQSGSICSAINLSRQSYHRYVRLFEEGGAAALFPARVSPLRKFDKESVKKAAFALLHQPPRNFGINRTTWKMADLSRIMKETGEPAGEGVIRKIAKEAGYRWRKARVVLTSNDAEFSEKLHRIQSILSGLKRTRRSFQSTNLGLSQ
jgi:transposase